MQFHVLVPQKLLLEIAPTINLKQAYLLSGVLGMIAKKNFLRAPTHLETPASSHHQSDGSTTAQKYGSSPSKNINQPHDQQDSHLDHPQHGSRQFEKINQVHDQKDSHPGSELDQPQHFHKSIIVHHRINHRFGSTNRTIKIKEKNTKNIIDTAIMNNAKKYVWITTKLLQRQLPLLAYQSQRVIARQLRVLVKLGLLKKKQWPGDPRTYWWMGTCLEQGLSGSRGGTFWCDKTNKEQTNQEQTTTSTQSPHPRSTSTRSTSTHPPHPRSTNPPSPSTQTPHNQWTNTPSSNTESPSVDLSWLK